ncbi:hypothetical protein B566_EDAN017148 [Ephemera danica]|nr:hypothetical protein B566_EDAN017148 [Ephemera danica]
MTPNHALDNEREARRNLYAGKPKEQQAPKLAIGDHVRISREKALFGKGFKKNCSREIFKIVEMLWRVRVVYKLEDLLMNRSKKRFMKSSCRKLKMSSFYVTLPSNSSMVIHPGNTVNTFTTSLPRRMILREDYEVALMEIHYPNTMYDIHCSDCYLQFRQGHLIYRVLLNNQSFSIIEQLIDILNNLTRNGNKVINIKQVGTKYIHYKVLLEHAKVKFSPRLANQLGLSMDEYKREDKSLISHNIYFVIPRYM